MTGSSLAPRASALFAEAFDGAAPAGVWFAPGRVNLMGEHTDYNDGFVLPMALPLGTAVAVRPRRDDIVRAVSRQADGALVRGEMDLSAVVPGSRAGWLGYLGGVGWAARRDGLPVSGLDVAVVADLPMGAGLSSSASLSCAAAIAWRDLAGWDADGDRLAAFARTAENTIVGAPTGVMDQLASVYGRADHALLIDTRADADGRHDVREVPLSLAASGLTLLVIDSRTPHELVDGAYGERRADCARAAELLGVPALRDVPVARMDELLASLPERVAKRARHIVTDSARAEAAARLLGDRASDPRDLGPLMNASHASMRDDFENSADTVDLIAATAVAEGAYGARMTGGGFGGCVIALADDARVDGLLSAVRRASAAAGHPRPEALAAHAADGARRLA